MRTSVLVTGAGGFIGNALVTYLKDRGYRVRGVDLKLPEYGTSDADEFELLDLRREVAAALGTELRQSVRHIDVMHRLVGAIGR